MKELVWNETEFSLSILSHNMWVILF